MSSTADPVASPLKVAVAYVGPETQVLRPMEVAPGTTAQGAIEGSGVLDQCPEIDLRRYRVGIYGRLVPLAQTLEDGDRVEIYRPLIADPKEARKRRADAGKPMRKGAA
jgi:uncharacterized protein